MEGLFQYQVMLLFCQCKNRNTQGAITRVKYKDADGVKKNIKTTLHSVEETFCDREVLNLGNSDTLELLIAVMMATEGCVTLNRWGRLRERKQKRRGCVRKCFGFCIYPWRSGLGERVECSLSLFSSIRLSGGGKHGAHPPVDYSSNTAKPPYSHVQAAVKHMYSL